MKNINGFCPKKKYDSSEYELISDGIYRYKKKYVTALSFQQEPEFEEGTSAADISQYPLEDILDKFGVYVSDFFEELNSPGSEICYLEFTGLMEKNVVSLRSIIGKHVYCHEVCKNNSAYAELIIE